MNLAVVDHHAVAGAHAGAHFGGLAVDFDIAARNALLEHAARAQAGVGQHLVQALFQRLGFGVSMAVALVQRKHGTGRTHVAVLP